MFFGKKVERVETLEDITEDEKMLKSLAGYIESNTILADEALDAYYRLCGVGEDAPVSERVAALQLKMQEMTDAHFPLNKFGELIREMQDVEHGERDYKNFVDLLDISSQEKDVLHSIVKKGRSGMLVISSEHEYNVVAEIAIVAGGVPSNVLGFALGNKLKQVVDRVPEGQKIAVYFEAE